MCIEVMSVALSMYLLKHYKILLPIDGHCFTHFVICTISLSSLSLLFPYCYQLLSPPSPLSPLNLYLHLLLNNSQVLHIILTDFNYEESAFQRAKQVHTTHRTPLPSSHHTPPHSVLLSPHSTNS
jgi:hypothetical protein